MGLRFYSQISMQGMAEDGVCGMVPRENQELFGCSGVGAHQNGSTGLEGTSWSVGARVGEGAESTLPTTQLCSAVPLYSPQSGETLSERGQAEKYFSPNPRGASLEHEGAQSLHVPTNLYNAYGQPIFPAAYSPYVAQPSPPGAAHSDGRFGLAAHLAARRAAQPGCVYGPLGPEMVI